MSALKSDRVEGHRRRATPVQVVQGVCEEEEEEEEDLDGRQWSTVIFFFIYLFFFRCCAFLSTIGPNEIIQ